MAQKKSQLWLKAPKRKDLKKIDSNILDQVSIVGELKTKRTKVVKWTPTCVTPLSTPRKLQYKSPLYKHFPTFKATPKSTSKSPILTPFKSPAWKRRKISISPKATVKNLARDFNQTKNNSDSQENITLSDQPWLQDFADVLVDTETSLPEPSYTSEIDELMKLLPNVVNKLSKQQGNVLLEFFQQVNENRFPLNNMAYQLWCEVVEWYNTAGTSEMRYSPETKKFWKLGWRHFGGRFIRFMSGFKNLSQVTYYNAVRGKCDPNLSDINFAVPSIEVLRSYTPYGEEITNQRKPGILYDVIQEAAMALKNTSVCVTFDGKKLKQGLTETNGDVDLLGFEDGLSLQDKQATLQSETDNIREQIRILKLLDCDTNIADIPEQNRVGLIRFLKLALQTLGQCAQNVRTLKVKKTYALDKFYERGGNNWRGSKFVYVISAIKALLYDIDRFLEKYDRLRNSVCCCLALLNNTENVFVCGKYISLSKQSNYNELEDTSSEDPLYIKQRTSDWFAIRSKALVTGSTLYKALGYDGLHKQKEHFEKVVCGVPEKPPTAQVQANMEYGTKNEINAIGTLVGKVIPVLFPGMHYNEIGCIRTEVNNKPFMVVSPDGSVSNNEGRVEFAVEVKCPTKEVHTSIPMRYYLQCQSEMVALNAQKLIYLSWRPDISTVFQMEYNDDVYNHNLNEAKAIYACEKPRKPNASRTNLHNDKVKIEDVCKSSAFLGEFESLEVVDQMAANVTCDTYSVKEVCEMLRNFENTVIECYQIQRQKASEAVVFICCDLDRNWSKNPFRYAPICWFPKGYSLTVDIMRKIAEKVLNECHANGIHVPAQSFDGQFHQLVVRSNANKPLTLFQLQKDIWHLSQKTQKSEILKVFQKVNKNAKWWKESSAALVCSNGGIDLPKTGNVGWAKRPEMQLNSSTADLEEERLRSSPTLTESVPEEVREATDVSAMLRHVETDQFTADEISSCNIRSSDWENQIRQVDMETDVSCGEYNLTDSISMIDLLCGNHEGTNSTIESLNPQSSALSAPYRIAEEDAKKLLSLFRTHKEANKKGYWDSKDVNYIMKMCEDKQSLTKLRNVDLGVIVKYVKSVAFTEATKCGLKESDKKMLKIDKLCKLFHFNDTTQSNGVVLHRGRPTKVVKTLAAISLSVLAGKKMPKQVLNIAYAGFIWPSKLQSWRDKSPVANVQIDGRNDPEFWFYVPDFREARNQLEVKCIDSSHLLTRTRRKICKGGIENMDNKPWVRVALKRNTFLSLVMVEDTIDPMSVPMAVTHISRQVEEAMKTNGDLRAAALCRDVRNWWESEDNPGISAVDRIAMRSGLRQRLLKGVDFSRFPPLTAYVNGWPAQLWEALIANIDAKAMLYSICKTGTYNVRAFSSMMCETYFAELYNQDHSGHGTVSAENFSKYIGSTVDQPRTRLDSDRCFAYRTSKSTVYQLVDKDDFIASSPKAAEKTADTIFHRKNHIDQISPRDHFFDTDDRERVKGKLKFGAVSTDRNSLQKGTLGVRWEKSRVNESKILLTKKMGLQDDQCV